MSRTGIRYQDVLDAVVALENQGIIPTIETVRGVLGTGSNSTISNYLKLWRNGVHPTTVIRRQKEPTPDLVKDAVERVWQDINAKASSEVEAIKHETQALIEAAEEKAAAAEKKYHNLQLIHDELQEISRAQYAENEKLLLDLKKMTEEHLLLKERFAILDQCYGDIKVQTSQHLENLSHTYKTKIERLTENIKIQSEDYAKAIHSLKDQTDKERNQYGIAIEQLKADNKTLTDVISKLQLELQEKITLNSQLQASLNLTLAEKEQATRLLSEHEKKWSSFNDKTLISTDVLNKIIDAPVLDEWVSKIHKLIDTSFSDKIFEIKNFFKSLEDKEKLESSNG